MLLVDDIGNVAIDGILGTMVKYTPLIQQTQLIYIQRTVIHIGYISYAV